MFKSIGIALSFLTCLPVDPGKVDLADMRRAVGFFPFAGVVLGGIIAGVFWVGVVFGMPNMVLAVVVSGLLAWLTRGLHLDGVADLADGFGGSLEPQRRLEIMKDSATGSFGVAALIVLFLLKVAGLFHLGEYGLMSLPVLFMTPVASRFWMVVVAYGASYPREAGTGHFVIGQVHLSQIGLAALFLSPFIMAPFICLVVISFAVLPALVLRFRANKLIGGVTGDVLGGVVEWGEAFGFLGGLLYLGMIQ